MKIDDENINLQIRELYNKLEEQEAEIKKLNKKIKEEKIISYKTKEYLFILENKNNQQHKEIEKLKKTMKEMKNSKSWKITKPLRKLKNYKILIKVIE